MRAWTLILMLIPLVLVATACGGGEGGTTAAESVATEQQPGALPQGGEPVELDPADFVAEIDNPYWPMSPGSTWIYRETDAEGAEQRVEVTVTDRTKTILGIEATVVHDVVTEDGELIEDTFDWYAQDTTGNVWYLGEATEEFENGKVTTTAGSWEAGVDGAQAGIIVPADPEVGMTYQQEYYAGEAEDEGEILSLDERAEVPFGSFDNLLMTKDTTPLEPDILEHKFYAEGIGPILALGLSGGVSREELLRYESGAETGG
jgi:hypothetical protein